MKSSKLELVGTYLRSGWGKAEWTSRLAELRFVCLFIGTPRSGHSIVGAVLDAHPDAMVAHEAGVVRYLAARFDRHRLVRIMAENARVVATEGRMSQEHSYRVPGQWQGRIRDLRVIGDKQAARTTRRLRARPRMLQRLRDTFGVPVRFLQVSRNPFDNIATMARRTAAEDGRPLDLVEATDRYFELQDGALEVRRRLRPGELEELRHEAFVRDPRAALEQICRWLELQADEDYLDACVGIVYDAPHRSREAVNWGDGLVDEVCRRLESYPWLTGYGRDG